MARSCFTLLLLVLAWQRSFTETPPPATQTLTAVRTTEPIKIDGILSETTWQQPGFTGFQQQEPAEGEHPSYPTKVWFAYDDGAFYFAARYSDPHPDSIMARLVRRDFIWSDPSDGCVLYIDSYHDHRNGYFFYVSAAGALADGILANDVKQPNDLSWDAVWEGASHIDTDGWYIEMKIPFSQFRFNEGASQTWGVNVERYISRKNETDMIAYTPRDDNRFSSRFPDLIGVEGVTSSAHIEMMPYVTGKAERIGNDFEDPFNRRNRGLPGTGLDLKAGIGSQLMLNATVNPDFCQVEVDPANVNLTDIETLYEEKRPFFTEGVGNFQFGKFTGSAVSFNWSLPQLFYSRRIGRTPERGVSGDDPQNKYYADIPRVTRILGATKISGQVGDEWKVGSILALTNREQAEVNDNGARSQIEIEPLTYYGVARAQRDFHAGHQGIGFISTYTRRQYQDDALQYYTNSDAAVAGADGYMFLDDQRSYAISGWGAASRVTGSQSRMTALQRSSGHYFQRPDAGYLGVDSAATALTGYSGRITVNKSRGQWIFNSAVGFITPGFEVNDLGINPFSDFINMHFYTTYRWNTPTPWYQHVSINAATYASYDFGGNVTGRGYWMQGGITLPSYYGGTLTVNYAPESYSARMTRGGPLTLNPVFRTANLNLFTDNRDWWVLNLTGSVRTGEAANTQSVTTALEVKTTKTLTISVGPTLIKEITAAQYFTAFADPTATTTYGKRYLFSRLDRNTLSADVRADWILSPRLSFQVYVQPYITTGTYGEYKSLTAPKSFSFDPYTYTGNRDFNYISLQGNAVLRWEYLPGSTMYFVWTQSRLDDRYEGDFALSGSMDRMFNAQPDNILMLKVSYWLGM